MKSILFIFSTYIHLFIILIPLIQHVAAERKLCDDDTGINTPSCSKQIIGHSDNDMCKVEVFPKDSEECKMMLFGPIMPNKHIGDVSLEPYIYTQTVDSINGTYIKYNQSFTVLNITFTNIKWKTMKFRFQRYGQVDVKNHCRNIVLSSDVTVNDQSVLYYDCYWSVTDGNYMGQNYMLDFEATDEKVINRGQYHFTIPTRKMLSTTVSVEQWRPFMYIEIRTGTLKLHIMAPPRHISMNFYRLEVMRACDKRTQCEEVTRNATLKVTFGKEVTYEYNLLGNHGSYYFVVTPLHEKCLLSNVDCQSVRSPTVFISNEVQETTYICIASFTALIVATLFAYYIALRLVRRYWCKDYSLALGNEIPTPPKILVIYSSANKLHTECVASFVTYLRSEYGMSVMYDGDIAATTHGDPYIWNEETFAAATHVMYIVGPADESNRFNIYEQPIHNVHRDVDAMQLNLLRSKRFKKEVCNVLFEHSNGPIPIETRSDRVFLLLKDWQKLVTHLSRNLLPKQQMMRTEKGRCFLEDLKRAKKLLSSKTNDVVIKLDNCKINAYEKKVLL